MTRDLFRTLGYAVSAAILLGIAFLTLAAAETSDLPAEDATVTAPDDATAEEMAAGTPSEDVAIGDPETSPEASPLRPIPALARLAEAEATPLPARATPTDEHRQGPVTGFALPRFVSLGASEANARRGPSRSHRIDWVFVRRGMPVMVVAEHGHWRRVVDRDGVGGWMHYSLLSGLRSAIVEQDMLPLYSRPDAGSPVRARAEMGVIGRLRECQPGWCLMEVGGHRGWVETAALWGVEPGETFD